MRAVLFAAAALASGGCVTLHNPAPDAVPVRRLPDEVLRAPACGPTCGPACTAGESVARANKPAVRPAKGELPPPDEVIDGPTCAPPACGAGAVFYTGGALGSGQFPLSTDMRVTEAVAVARGPLKPGAGRSAPSRVTVLRRLATGQQLAIRVDLNEALRDPRENIAMWPNDMILTSETACEATGRALGHFFRITAGLPMRVVTGGAVR
ncbi:MAG: hypothetical protein FJ304_20675 [Planctomycetes bacterium]|nr:hypothetical protein [Planctomycetota bacterium]